MPEPSKVLTVYECIEPGCGSYRASSPGSLSDCFGHRKAAVRYVPESESVPRSPVPATVEAKDADYVDSVRCVVMPCCGFVFDADHTDDKSDPPTYTCPNCAESVPRELAVELAEAADELRKWAEEAHGHYGIEDCAGPGAEATAWDEVQDALARAARDAREPLKEARTAGLLGEGEDG